MDGSQTRRLEEIRRCLEEHMAARKPKRYRHSLGVSETASALARAYGVDEFDAAAAGLVHDWEKVLSDAEMVERAHELGVSLDGDERRTIGLLHGPVAAVELRGLFPDLSEAVFQAVARHTIGAVDMSPLDMVVFVADAMEPGRRGEYADSLRGLVGTCSLDELFFQCFSEGLVYVLRTGRYLYPTAADIYNAYAMMREGKRTKS